MVSVNLTLGFSQVIAALKRYKWLGVVTLVALFSFFFVVSAFFYSLGSWSLGQWKAVVHVGLLFLVLGALYGSVAALDSRSPVALGNHDYIRMMLCALFGAAVVLVIWSWQPANFNKLWALLGAAIGATLGWIGWRWAKYVDF